MSRRVLIFAIAGSLVFAAFLIAVAGSMTYWFGLNRPATNAGSAQSLCEDAVRHELLAPGTASFLETYTKLDRLTEDDHAGLHFDAANVKEVWAVGGDVESRGANGDSARSHFTCRAYLFDGKPPQTTVDFARTDEAGQRTTGS